MNGSPDRPSGDGPEVAAAQRLPLLYLAPGDGPGVRIIIISD